MYPTFNAFGDGGDEIDLMGGMEVIVDNGHLRSMVEASDFGKHILELYAFYT